MRPILAEIPQLPVAFFFPFAALCLALGVVLGLRAQRAARMVPAGVAGHTEDPNSALAFPLLMSLGAMFGLWMWSRQPIVLHSYGLFLILGFSVAVYGSCLEAKRRGIDPNIIVDMSLPLLGFSILACRLLYVALNREQFHSAADIVRVWDGGLSFHGSLVAAPAVVWFFARKNGLTFWQLADVIAPAVFIGYAIGRLGCLMNGCCYGKECDLPWAMTFPSETNRNVMTPPSHPTQLYSTILGLCLFGVMQKAKKTEFFNEFPGKITILFFALYSVERAFIEYFRNGATARTVFGTTWLTQAQLTSILSLLGLAVVYAILAAHARRRTRTVGANPPSTGSHS